MHVVKEKMEPESASTHKIVRHPDVSKKDLKRLRRFRTIEKSLEYFERLLSTDTPSVGRPIPGFSGRRVMKGDLHIIGMGPQGRGAARVIYEIREEACEIVYVYAKNEDLKENAIREEVKSRLGIR